MYTPKIKQCIRQTDRLLMVLNSWNWILHEKKLTDQLNLCADMSQDRKIPELCSVEIHPFRCRPPLQPAWWRARPSERTFPPGTGTIWWFWWPRWSLWLTSASSCWPCPSLCPTRWGSAAGGRPFPGSRLTHLLSVTNRLQNHIWLAG